MLSDIAFWSYILLLISSFGTGGIYVSWLVWVLRANKGLTNGARLAVSAPYLYDMMLFFGIGISVTISLIARIALHINIEYRDDIIHSWIWSFKLVPVIIPMILTGLRAYLRIHRSSKGKHE